MKGLNARVALGAVVLILAGVVIWAFGHELHRTILDIKAWVGEQGVLGWAVFVVGFVVLSSLTIPDSLLCIAAGVLFGFVGGLGLVLVGATSARVVQFVLARRILAARVLRFVESRPRITRITQAALRDQTRLQFMIRLTPMSFTLVSYVFGAIGVGFPEYMCALVGTLPLHLMIVYIGVEGAAVAEISASETAGWGVRDALQLVGLAANFVVLVFVTKVAIREVKRAAEPADPEQG